MRRPEWLTGTTARMTARMIGTHAAQVVLAEADEPTPKRRRSSAFGEPRQHQEPVLGTPDVSGLDLLLKASEVQLHLSLSPVSLPGDRSLTRLCAACLSPASGATLGAEPSAWAGQATPMRSGGGPVCARDVRQTTAARLARLSAALGDNISPLGALAALVSKSPFPAAGMSPFQGVGVSGRGARQQRSGGVLVPQRARSSLPQARRVAPPRTDGGSGRRQSAGYDDDDEYTHSPELPSLAPRSQRPGRPPQRAASRRVRQETPSPPPPRQLQPRRSLGAAAARGAKAEAPRTSARVKPDLQMLQQQPLEQADARAALQTATEEARACLAQTLVVPGLGARI